MCPKEMTGKRTKRYWIFLYSQGNLYASSFIPRVYVYNSSISLNRSHHLPNKIFITNLNLYQSLIWEMELGKAEMRSSAVKDTEALLAAGYSKINKTCVYLLFWCIMWLLGFMTLGISHVMWESLCLGRVWLHGTPQKCNNWWTD